MKEMVQFARSKIVPVPDISGNPAYRCSAHLLDGTYLPCVLLCSAEAYTELAISRFNETRTDARTPKMFGGKRFGPGMQYPDIVRSFLTDSNRVTHYAVEHLDESPYAISPERLSEVRGETRMCWTQFTVEMTDGSEHDFGTTWSTEFFSMPDGYTAGDIAKIHSHPTLAPMPEGIIYRERPFFTCYIEGLGGIQANPTTQTFRYE